MKNIRKNKRIDKAEHCHQNGVPLFLCNQKTEVVVLPTVVSAVAVVVEEAIVKAPSALPLVRLIVHNVLIYGRGY
jgi:hypothetical protein